MDFSLDSLKNIKVLKSLLKRKHARLGIDVEGGMAKIVRVDRNEDGEPVLGGFAEAKFDFSLPVENLGEFQLAVKRLGRGNDRVAVSIDHPTLRIRRMTLPKMPDSDILQAVKWNFREHVEIPMERYTVGFHPLSEHHEENKVSIIAFGVAEEIITEYVLKFRLLGFKAISIEPVSSAILASFKLNGALEDNLYHVCVVLGRSISNFIVMKGSELLFSRPLAGISAEALVKKISRDLAMMEGPAADMIENWMHPPQLKEGEVPQPELPMFVATTRHFYSQLVIEIQRSMDAFSILYGVEKIDRIHLCGIGVGYPGIVEHVQKTLAVATAVFNPFEKIMDPTMQRVGPPANAPQFAVAVGLSIP